MTFLQPILLFGLPLALIPVIIHLLNRIRHRPLAWAAMRFLVAATQSSASSNKLRQWLILLCRALAVAVLVLFLARPLAGGWMGWALSPAPDAILILLDRSASMETKAGGTTKRDQALAFLAREAKGFEESSHLVLIDSATRQAKPFAKAATLTQWDATGATDTAADVPAMMRSAFDWLMDNHAGSAEVWIASDAQRSNWLPDDPRWKSTMAQFSGLSQRVRVRLLSMDQQAEANASVGIQEALRHARGAQSELRLTVDLQRNRGGETSIPLTLTLDGARSEVEAPMDGQSVRWRHKVDLGTRSEGGWGSIALPSDANEADNRAYFVYGPDVAPQAAVVSDDLQTARFLQFAAAGRDGQPAARIATADVGSADFAKLGMIVWQAPMPTGAEADRLNAFASEGGVVVFFPVGTVEGPELAGGSVWGPVQNAAEKGTTFHVRRWNEDEGPLAKSDEHLSLPLTETTFAQRRPFGGLQETLAAFDDGTPFLARTTMGKGQIYCCASLPDEKWSSLSDGPVLVPMLQRMLEAGAQRLEPVSTSVCGDLSAVDRAVKWTSVDSTTPKDIRTQAGVYRAGERLMAVNRPAAEDEPEILPADEIRKLFGDIPFQMMQERRERFGQLQGEVWRIFVFAMLIILVAEGFLILPAKRLAKEGNKMTGKAKPEAELVS